MQAGGLQCVGFIMDGNRRWAKDNGLTGLDGHQKALGVFEESIEWVADAGIEHAVYYAFSTENWNRSAEEIDYLMDLFLESFTTLQKRVLAGDRTCRFRVVGRKTDFNDKLQKKIDDLESLEVEEAKTTVWIALSYGGRAEILDAVNQAVVEGREVTSEEFEKYLWTADMPDPDLIVRTSGEQRLSNFMTWRSVYSELYFADKHWPALTENDFKDILKEYEKRERRRGA